MIPHYYIGNTVIENLISLLVNLVCLFARSLHESTLDWVVFIPSCSSPTPVRHTKPPFPLEKSNVVHRRMRGVFLSRSTPRNTDGVTSMRDCPPTSEKATRNSHCEHRREHRRQDAHPDTLHVCTRRRAGGIFCMCETATRPAHSEHSIGV
jgi:hypothetical protein